MVQYTSDMSETYEVHRRVAELVASYSADIGKPIFPATFQKIAKNENSIADLLHRTATDPELYQQTVNEIIKGDQITKSAFPQKRVKPPTHNSP